MNATEERLVDALKTMGETLRPEDVPPLTLPAKRRLLSARPLTFAAAAASLVAVLAGTGVAIVGSDVGPERTTGPLAQQAARDELVVIFLCTRTSANPACGRTAATPEQRTAISNSLRSSPAVRKVAYEDKREAFQRFKERFEESLRREMAKEGDIPDSFWVTVRRPQDREEVKASMIGRLGVDRIFFDAP